MRSFTPLAAISVALLGVIATAAELPSWAYPVNPPDAAAPVEDTAPRHVPASAVTFTRKEIAAIGTQVPDWHPAEHPAMPGIVAKGRPPLVYACGYCHLPTGAG